MHVSKCTCINNVSDLLHCHSLIINGDGVLYNSFLLLVSIIFKFQGLFLAAIGSIAMLICLAMTPHNEENLKKRFGNNKWDYTCTCTVMMYMYTITHYLYSGHLSNKDTFRSIVQIRTPFNLTL